MKLKKFFAGVLATAMMLTVGATAAFAETPSVPAGEGDTAAEKTLTTTTDLGITKVYEINKGNSPAVDFYFDAIYKSALSTPYGTDAGKDVKDIKVSFGASNGTDSKTLGLTIEQLGLNNPKGPGKYVFEIKEQIPTSKVAGVAYDENTRYLSVTIANKENDNGTYAQNEYVYYAQLYTQYNKGADNSSYKADASQAFVNKYGNDGTNDLVHNLVIAKAVEGNFADLNETFNFKVTLSAADGKANNYAGANVISAPEAAGVSVNQVLEIGKEYTISLKRNEKVELSNIPAGVKVTVEELNGDGYAVSLDNSVENGGKTYNLIPSATLATGTTKVDKAVMPETNASVGFRNIKEGTPDMGVVLDNAPYIAMLAVVAIGGVALMLNKRRRDEE